MMTDTQAKDLSIKRLILPIDVVNKTIRESAQKFLNARILKKKEVENAKGVVLASVKEYSKPNLSIEDIISQVYKIRCQKVSWEGEEKVKIEYYEN